MCVYIWSLICRKMHCLVFPGPDAKKMEEESTETEVRSPQQAISEGLSSPASEPLNRNIASSVLFEDSIAGGGLTSSYGIQALINNVHLGYVNSDQMVDATNLDEADELAAATYDDDSFPHDSEILRSIAFKTNANIHMLRFSSQGSL